MHGAVDTDSACLQALVDVTDVSLSHAFSAEQGWFEFGAIADWRAPVCA